MNSQILNTILIIALFICPIFVQAADLDIRPFLIDKTVEGREYVTEEVTLTNNTTRRLDVYATVNEISVDAEGEIKEFVSPIMTDRSNTITSWVEVTRGQIEIPPGESVAVPISFRIHPNPQPGDYHAFIGFVPASKRFQAEAKAMTGDADGIIVKLKIEDKSTEYLRIAGFLIDRFVTTEGDKKVQIELENLGDVTATPSGEIIFFNSKGEELHSIPVNTDQLTVPPGETVTITSELPFDNELGRYKANLSLQYGQKQRALLYDSTQFFMMPLHIILLMLVIAVLVGLLVFFLLHRSLSLAHHDDDEHGFDLPFMVRDGHDAEPKHHDIDLKKKE